MPTLKYLDYDGLGYFWDKIDAKKQNKLTAGAGISITGDTISAIGGGTADAVEWDNVLNKPSFATVATSGSYNDLSDKPKIPTVYDATLTIQRNGTNVGKFTANSSSNVTANITVPTKTSELTNDSGFLKSVGWGDVVGKPTFATVATSGSYNDLSNKPTIPTVNNAVLTILQNGVNVGTFFANDSTNRTVSLTDTQYKNATDSTAGLMSAADKSKLNSIDFKAEVNVQSDWSVTDSSLDSFIKNKPTIPTVNNAMLTIQKNGVTVERFTANASDSVTANITVPTKTSDLTNDSGFIDAAAIADKQNLLSPGTHIDITNDVISATGYVRSENPQASAAASSTITGSMIANGTITADKLATGATVKLTMSTSDIGEGAPLAANTLYGVYI